MVIQFIINEALKRMIIHNFNKVFSIFDFRVKQSIKKYVALTQTKLIGPFFHNFCE